MKAQRVYIDTSVLGGCFDAEFARWSNALMADFRSGRLKPVISEIITAKAVEMVRRIRDAHYEQLRGKSPEERIAFYRTKARGLQAEIAAQRPEQPTNELQPA